MDEVDLKGILPFIIFLPYFFTIAAMKLLFYDDFYAKIKIMKNKVRKIILISILILSALFIAATLQTVIYYIIFEVLSAWK